MKIPEEANKENSDTYAKALADTSSAFVQKVKELSIVKRAGECLRGLPDRKRIATEIADIIIDETFTENCSLWFINKEKKEMKIVSARGQLDDKSRYFPADDAMVSSIAWGEGIIGWVVENGHPILIKDTSKSKVFKKVKGEISGSIRSILCLPIKNHDEVIGVLNLSHPDTGAFTRANRFALDLVAGQAGVAISSLFMFEKVTDMGRLLEEKVKKRTWKLTEAMRDLAQAKEEAEEAVKIKNRFVSLIGHDLRSPLSSTIIALEMILDDSSSGLADRYRSVIKKLLEGNRHMMNMIENMVMVGTARKKSSLARKKFIDAHRQVDMALTMFDLVAKEKSVTLVNAVFPGTRLYADEALFRHLLANLVGNAIKYSNPEEKVTVSMDESSPTTVTVTDTGTGIDETLIDSIFAEDIKTTTMGTAGERGGGLGLPWCSEIMRLHGGAINVESLPGKGSTFYATFPVTTPKVVVVTQSKENKNSILRILRTLSATGVEFTKGAEVIDYCREYEPHLVITELDIKADDRHCLLERLKGDTRTGSTPVIAMATSNLHDEHERAIRLGADEFLILPVSRKNLLPLIRKHII